MTQIVFDLEHLDRFLDRLGGDSPIPVLVGIFPLWSYRLALRLHNELPGIIVPDSVQEALRDAGPDAPTVGMAHRPGAVRGRRGAAPPACTSWRRSGGRSGCSSCLADAVAR